MLTPTLTVIDNGGTDYAEGGYLRSISFAFPVFYIGVGRDTGKHRWWVHASDGGCGTYGGGFVPYTDPALGELARHCPDWTPIVDWLIENAHSSEQKKLAAALEALLAGGDQ